MPLDTLQCCARHGASFMELRFRRHLLAAACWLAHQDQLISNQCPHDQPKRDLYQLETWCNRTCIRCAGACPPRISSSSALCTARPLRYAADAATWMNQFGELRQIADSRNDILAEAAGITAGSWYAWPSAHLGYELIAAGMLILAGDGRGFPFDYDELER